MMPKEMAVTVELYFPHDEIYSQNPNFDLAADYLELTPFVSDQNGAAATGLIDAKETGSEDEYNGIDEEMTDREKSYPVQSGESIVGSARLAPHIPLRWTLSEFTHFCDSALKLRHPAARV